MTIDEEVCWFVSRYSHVYVSVILMVLKFSSFHMSALRTNHQRTFQTNIVKQELSGQFVVSETWLLVVANINVHFLLVPSALFVQLIVFSLYINTTQKPSKLETSNKSSKKKI